MNFLDCLYFGWIMIMSQFFFFFWFLFGNNAKISGIAIHEKFPWKHTLQIEHTLDFQKTSNMPAELFMYVMYMSLGMFRELPVLEIL